MATFGAPRVVVVIGKLDRGGAELQLLKLLPRLKARQVEVSVFTLHAGGVLVEAMRRAGVEVVAGTARRGLRALPAIARQFAAHLRAERPDVVHFFLPEAYAIGAACALCVSRARRVMSRRSLNNYQAKYPAFGFIERILHRSTRVIIGNSRAVVAQLLGEGVPAHKLSLIYNGIEPRPRPSAAQKQAARRQLGIAENVVTGVTIANLKPYKGHATLLHALAQLRHSRRTPLKWLFVGRDDGLGGALNVQARDLNLIEVVQWVGEQPDPTLYLDAADIAVLPSFEEGFSNALLEKMRAGLPIVATAVGGNPDALGDCGILIRPDSPDVLAAALRSLLDGDQREHLGNAASQRVEQYFSFDRCTELYAELYVALARDAADPIPPGARIAAP